MPLILPLMRGGGLHYRVMLCGRGLRTTHTHRPLTTYFLGAKIRISEQTTKFSSSKFKKKFTYLLMRRDKIRQKVR